jgi:hypothetical protein
MLNRAEGGRSEVELTIQSESVDVFTIISENHVLLAQSDGVFASGHTVKLF